MSDPFRGRTPFHRLYLNKQEAQLLLSDMAEAMKFRQDEQMDPVRANLYHKVANTHAIIPALLMTGSAVTARVGVQQDEVINEGDFSLDDVAEEETLR